MSLENGDRLTQSEFHRRYEALPDIKKAELIEGIVFMGSPVRFRHHASPHAAVIQWLGAYSLESPGTVVADNLTVILDAENEPQPDAVLLIDPTRGGQCRINANDYVVGAPELVVEIAASTVSKEYGAKMNAYRRNGVKEYLVWRVEQGAFDWFVLKAGGYELQDPDSEGLLRSVGFSGLWLHVESLLAGNVVSVLRHLQRGIDSDVHNKFVRQLARKQRK